MEPLLNKNYIVIKKASRHSGYSVDYLMRLCRAGRIQGTQVGRTWLVRRSSLEQFVRAQEEKKREMGRELSKVREQEYKQTQAPKSATFIPLVKATIEKKVNESPRLAEIHPILRPAFALAVTVLVLTASVWAADSGFITRLGGGVIASALRSQDAGPVIPEKTAYALVTVGEYAERGLTALVTGTPAAYRGATLALASTPRQAAAAAAFAPIQNDHGIGERLAVATYRTVTNFFSSFTRQLAVWFGISTSRLTIVPFEVANTLHPSTDLPVPHVAVGGGVSYGPITEHITNVTSINGASVEYVNAYVDAYVTNALRGLSARIGAQVLDGQGVHRSSTASSATSANSVTNGTISNSVITNSSFTGGDIIADSLQVNGNTTITGTTTISGPLVIGGLNGITECLHVDANGVVSGTGSDCGSGGGGGITGVRAQYSTIQTGATQTFATSSDANIGLTITSAGNTHTFTPVWTGVLSVARGGLGLSSVTANGLLIGNSAGTGYTTVATTSLGLSTSDISEGANLYYTLSRFAAALAGTTTDALAEGVVNRYYTDARARNAFSATATGLTYTAGTGVLSLTSGYEIPLSASTSNWQSFYTTPSSRITAGTNLSWVGNTLNGPTDSYIRALLTATSPLAYDNTTGTFSIQQANGSQSGYLSSTDWTTFNTKFATTSTNYWLSTKTTDSLAQGSVNLYYDNALVATFLNTIAKEYFFSTSSADYWKSQRDLFSTTSASYFLAQNQGAAFSTTSSDFWLTTKTTDNLAQGATNKYYNDSLVNTFIGGSTTIPKTYTNNVFTGGNIFGLATVTSATTTNLNIVGTITGAGLTSCSLSSSKLLWDSATGQFSCGADAGAGGGITALKGQYSTAQTGSTQTFATTSDTNIGLTITSAGDTHTFSPVWIGTLAAARGGTGLSSIASSSILIGGAGNTITQMATSTLGLESPLTFNTPLSRSGNAISIQVANGSQNGYLSSTDWNTFNNKVSSTSLSATYPVQYNSGTGVFSLAFGTSTSNTWGGTQTFTNTPVLGTLSGLVGSNNGSLYQIATATNFVTSLTGGTGINVSGATGAITVTNTGVTAIAQSSGTNQTGAITLATSTVTANGQTHGIAITNSTGTFTFTPTISGTLGVAGGGTGAASFTAGQILYGNGTNALSSVATTTETLGSEFSYTGTLGSLVGGTSGTLSLATNGVALTKIAQIGANTILGNNTGATGNVVAFATSTLFGAGTNGFVLAVVNGVPTWTATSSINNGVSSIQQLGGGTAQTGAITFATSSATNNGVTIGLNITNSAGAFTFTPTRSGTLTVAGGGTGITSIASSSLLIGGPGNTFIGYATSSLGIALSDTTGTLAANRGGTGFASYTPGDILYADTAASLARVGSSTDGFILGLANGKPTWVATTTLSSITGTLAIAKGGTGTTTAPAGQILYGGGAGVYQSVATGTVSSGTGISVTAGQYIIGSGLTITNTGVTSIQQSSGSAQTGAITLATSSAVSFNGLSFTNSITNSSGTFTFTPALSGTLTVAGGGTGVSSFTAGQLVYGNGTNNLTSVATSSQTLSAEFSDTGTFGALVGGTSGTLSLATNGVAYSKLAQAAANTILGNPTGATGNLQAIATSSLGIAISDTTGTLSVARGGTGSTTLSGILRGNGTGQVSTLIVGSGLTFDGTTLATSGAGITSIGAAGQQQTGGTQTFATSTGSFNGLTLGMTVVSSANTHTFTPSITGTLGVAGGGTGAASFTAGALVYGAGTGALQTVGTTTETLSSEFAYTGTLGALVGGSSGTLSLATNGVALNKLVQIGANTILGNNTGATGNVVAFATSTLFGTGTGGQVLTIANGVPTWVASTTYSSGSGISTAFAAGNLTITNTGLLSLQQLGGGSAQTGAITFATSSQTTNGQTIGLNITNTSGAFTFAPTIGGTLTVAGGGTGQTTFTAGQILYGNGTNALSSVATSSVSVGSSLTVAGTLGSLIGGSNVTLSLNTNNPNTWTALQTFSAGASSTQISAATGFFNSVLATSSSATSTFAGGFSAASSLYVLQGGKVGIGTAAPGTTLDVVGTSRVSSTFTLSSVTSCTGAQALQTNGSGDISCGNIATGGASSGGGWTTNNVGVISLSTTTDKVVIGASTTPYAKLAVISGSAATTTLAILPASGQTANIVDIYNANGLVNSVINSSGFLGLATTSPTQQLSVQGNGLFSGNIALANLTATGTVSTANLTVTGVTSSLLSTDGSGVVQSTSVSSPLSFSGSTLSIANAVANGSTKGAATFLAADFNDDGSGGISIDYTNGQKANGSQPGFLAAADWTVFNNKISSTSLSAVYPLAYNSATGVFSTAFGTTTANTFSALNTFNGGVTIGTLSGVVYGNNGSLTSVATSTVANGTGISVSGSAAVVGAGGLTITNTGLLSLQQLGGGSAQTGAITFATSSQTTNGQTIGLNITNTSGAFTFSPTISGTLTVAGGGTGLTSVADGALVYGSGGSTLNALATSTSGKILQLDFTTGRPTWVATSTLGLVVNAITSIGPVGQGQTGPAITIASSSSTTNGLTSAITITAAGNTITYAPTLSGTLTVAGGGTGQSSLSSGQILYGAGTGAVQSVATGTVSSGTGISVTGNQYIIGSGLTITNTGVTSVAQSFGTNQTGAITFASSTVSANGQTHGIAITNSTGTFTFTPTISGTLNVAGGGTGLTTVADGSLVFGSGGTTLTALASSTGGFLTNSYTTGRPVWSATSTLNVALADTTGTLAANRGGTGFASYTPGDILYADTSSSFARVGSTTDGFILGLANGKPTWVATTTLSSITGTLAIAKGGTGTTTAPVGQLIYGGATAYQSVGTSTVANGTGISVSGSAAVVGAGGLTITNTGLLSLQQLGGGSAQTGAITFATSSNATTGLTLGLNITNSSGAFTFTPTLAGTLNVANGGTGQTSFTSSQLIYGNGANGLLSVATTSETLSSEFSFSGTYGSRVGGTSGTLSLATNGVAYSKLAQAAANTILGNPTGATGNIQAFATSSLGIALTDTTGTLSIARGGTGTTTAPQGQLIYGGATSYQSVATGTVSSGTGISVTGNQYIIGSGLTITNTGVTSVAQSFGTNQTGAITLATSSAVSFNGLTFTNSITNSSGTFTFTPALSGTLGVAGGGTGVGTFTAGQLIYGNGTNNLTSVGTTSETLSSEFSFSGTYGARVGGTSGTLSLATNGVAYSKLAQAAANTILGNNTGATGNVVAFATSSLGIALADTTGTLSIARGGTGTTTAPSGQIIYGGGAGVYQSVSTSTVANGTGISVSGSAAVVGAGGLTITNTGLLSLQQLGGGSAQTGAITFATSSQTTNGQTIGLNITNTSGAFTFSPTIGGTLTVAGGGTGATSLSSGQLIYGAGTGAVQSVATTSIAVSGAFSYSGTLGSLVGGANGTLSLATNGVALTNLAQIAANSVLVNNTSGTGNVVAIATSTFYGLGTGGQVLTWNNGVPQWVATTTYSAGSGISTSFAAGNLTINNTGLLSLQQLGGGSAQTGAITFATSSNSSTGLTLGLNITNTSGAFTFTPTLGGTLNVGNGGTGATSFTAGSLVYGAGTGALQSVATTTATLGLGLSGTLTTLNSGGTQQLSVATSSLYTGTTGQFPYFSGTNTITATSTLFLATNGNIGVNSTTPRAQFTISAVNTTLVPLEIWGPSGSGPQAVFRANNAVNSWGNGLIQVGGVTNGSSGLRITFNDKDGQTTFNDGNSDTEFINSNGSFLRTQGQGIILNFSKLATAAGYVGIGTTTPATNLSLQGNGLFSGNLSVAGFTATGTATVGNLTVGSLTGPLQAINGVVSATSTLSVFYGGTGTSTIPTFGKVLVGNSQGGYDLRATSTLGFGAGSVTSVDASGGTTGLSFSGGPITTFGTLTLSGTLGVANGGTGSTTLTGILKGNGTGQVQTAVAGTDYQAPITAGTGLSFTGNTLNSYWTLNGSNNLFNNNSGTRVGIATGSPNYALDVGGFINTGAIGGYKQNGKTILYASSTNSSTLVGADAGIALTSAANYAVAVGNGALQTSQSAQFNTAVGYQALNLTTTGAQNTTLGAYTLANNSTGASNVAIGYAASYFNAFATNTVAIGNEAANGAPGYYANQGSVAIGYRAGYNFMDASDYNTLLGFQAGLNITSGARNIIIGADTTGSNSNLDTGSNNISIGNNISLPDNAGSNQLNIGNLIFGTGLSGTGSTISTGNIGIGTTSPYGKLSVVGNVVAANFIATTSASSTFAGPLSVSNLAITSNSGILKASAGGYIVNAVAGTDYLTSASAVTSISQTGGGSAQTGAITFATSSVTSNGVTIGLNITNTSGAFTFTPTRSGTLTVAGGGTGVGSFTAGQLIYGNGTNNLTSVATTSATLGLGLSGTLTTLNAGGTQQLSIATSSLYTGTAGQVAYFSGTNSLVGTSTLFVNTNSTVGIGTVTPVNLLDVYGGTNAPAVIRITTGSTGNAAVASFTLESTNGSSQLFKTSTGYSAYKTVVANDLGFYNSSQAGNISILNDYASGKILLTSGGSSLPHFAVDSNGNVGVGTTSPFAKLSVHAFNGQTNTTLFAIGSSTASATSTLFSISNTGSTTAVNGFNITAGCFAINNNCLPTSAGVLSIQQTGGGSAQTGAITFATSSQTTNGQTIGLNITNSSGAFTFTPTLSGTLTVAGGGTGQTSFTSSQLIYGNGTNGLVSVGTTTATLGLGLSGTLTTINAGGTTQQLSIATSSLYTGTTGQFPYFSGTNTITATSTLFVSVSGNVGIASTSPWGQLSINPNALGVGIPEFVIGSSSATHFLVNQAGNVGIGTTSPFAKLSVSGTGTLAKFKSTTNTTAVLSVENATGVNVFQVDTAASSDSILSVATTTGISYFNVLGTGSVGVSSTSPYSLLAVHASNGFTFRTLFAIGSSTASATTTLFSIDNTGSTTAANGFNITAGCFAINNNCLSTGGSNYFTNSGSNTYLTTGSLLGIGSTTLSAQLGIQSLFTASSTPLAWLNINASSTPAFYVGSPNQHAFVGFGTTSPWAQVSINANTFGTAPSFVIGSSTNTHLLVSNAGFVGIATVTPTSQLSVNALAGFSPFSVGSSTSSFFHITSTGLTSIGSSTPWTKFSVTNGFGASSTPLASFNLLGSTTPTFYIGSANQHGFIGFGTSSPWAQVSINANTFGTAPSFVIGSSTATHFSVLNNGRVGIASTTPYGLLSIYSNTTPFGSSTPLLAVATIASTSPALFVSSPTTGALVGIGSSTPWAKLSLYSDYSGQSSSTPIFAAGINASSTPAFYIGSPNQNGLIGIGTTSPWASLAINPVAGAAANQFVIGSSTATNFIVTNAGRVGVGTTSPEAPFTVYTTGTSPQIVAGAPSAVTNALFYYTSGIFGSNFGKISIGGKTATNDALWLAHDGKDDYSDISFGSTNTSVLNIRQNGNVVITASNGRVGIGTMAATTNAIANARLEVSVAGTSDDFFMLSSNNTSAGDRFIVKNNGRVGIGTTSPFALFTIFATTTGSTASPSTLFQIASSSAGTATTTLFSISNTGTTTASNGFNITAGCFAINNNCLSTGGSNYFTNSGSNTYLTTGSLLGIGSTSPWGQLSVNPNALGTNVPEFVIGSSTDTHFIVTGGGKVGIGGNSSTNRAFTQLTVTAGTSTIARSGVASLSGSRNPGIYVQGRYAYVVEGGNTTNGFEIFDVSTTTPSLVSRTNLATGNNAAYQGNDISVQGHYAYVVEGYGSTNAFEIFDVSNPNVPVRISQSNLSSGEWWTNKKIHVQGRYAYILGTYQATNALQIFDISNPYAPVLVGMANVTNSGQSYSDLFVQGKYIYVVEGSGTTNAFEIFDASNPAAPVRVGQANLANTTNLSGNSIYVQGSYAYVVESAAANGFEIFDISDPSAPIRVSQTSTLNSGAGGTYADIYVQGRYAYIAGSGTTNAFEVYDVSDPAAPMLVSRKNLAVGGANALFIQGRYAYIAEGGTTNAFEVFDIGGAYIQQLETGSIETGDISARGNLLAFSGNIVGGLTVGQSFTVNGSASFLAASSTIGTTTNIFNIATASSTSSILSVLGNGNVGLGTTTPGARLAVSIGSTTPALYIGAAGSSTPSLYVASANAGGFVGIGTTTVIGSTATTTLLAVGNSSLAANSAAAVFGSAGGTCYVIPGNGVSCSSDIRLKKNVNNLAPALSIIEALRPVTYNWNAENPGDPTHSGFIAQEVAALAPDLVYTTPNGVLNLNYAGFTPYLASAIKQFNGVYNATNALNGTSTIRSFYQGTSTPAIVVDAAGNVGIGSTSPSYLLTVGGDIGALGFVNVSARATKFDINYLTASSTEDILDEINRMRVATYRYKGDVTREDRLGLIAEEAPSAVLTAGGKGVDLYKLASFTLAGVQALAGKVTTLETKVADIDARLTALQSLSVATPTAATTTTLISASTTALQSAFSGLGVLIQNGVAQFQTLVTRQLVFSKDADGTSSAGEGLIANGTTTITVMNKLVRPTSKVFVTWGGPVDGSWYVTDKKNGSFTISLTKPAGADIPFDYFLVQTEGQLAAAGSSGDTSAPTITLNGADPFYVAVGEVYVDPGASITDDKDGMLTYSLQVDGKTTSTHPNLDTSHAVTYTLTYVAVDAAGNFATKTRTVVVAAPGEPAAPPATTGTTTLPPSDQGSTTPPVPPPAESGSTTPPAETGSTPPPAPDTGGETSPATESGTTTTP